MNKKQDTVILFPNLLHRLQEKGFAALHEKRFEEALQCFKQLAEHGLQEERTEIATVICLMELNELQEAKRYCELFFQNSKQAHYDVIEMYMTILIQLQRYDELAEIVQRVLEEYKLADTQREKLYSLLSFSKKMTAGNDVNTATEYEELAPIFEGDDVMLQLQAVNEMKEYGSVRPVPFLLEFLRDEMKHPFIKSLIINLLIEAEVQKEIEIEKFGDRITIIPASLENVKEWAFSRDVIAAFERNAANDNPTLFEAMKEHWYQISFIFYPFIPNQADASVWAAVLHKIGYERFTEKLSDEKIERMYKITRKQLLEAYSLFLDIEKDAYMTV
ncbi:hypothetical protein [Bacillus sp. 165]|uniref:hypothetical protein n=1 Tax=Bacillus sp. 165 TaxID=1529117 RepID=UPI001ADA6784|nr:hypothetical protein [Bacillus sp. 165]MBO9130528.1 hypothetical protein [Bacillus sp. 165]